MELHFNIIHPFLYFNQKLPSQVTILYHDRLNNQYIYICLKGDKRVNLLVLEIKVF